MTKPTQLTLFSPKKYVVRAANQTPTYPVAPLLAHITSTAEIDPTTVVRVLAEQIQVPLSTVRRRVNCGQLTETEADKWAIRCGLHPDIIWNHFGQHVSHRQRTKA